MKLFKNKPFRPDEDIEDVYGPPEYFEPEPAEDNIELDSGDLADTIREAESMQLVYGPPISVGARPVLRGEQRGTASGPVFEKLLSCYRSLRQITLFEPQVALVLGSGLGDFAETAVDIECTVDYSQLEGFPLSTVEGHKGRFVFGRIGGVKVVVMQGRVHYYEGYPISDVVLPTRLMSMMGAEVLFLTNASGGINASFSAGDFMLITDHISSFVPNPLIGQNVEELGTRFPDMSHVYDPMLCSVITDTADRLGIKLQKGVYLQLTGPSFETPAEIRMLRGFGADAVGMSTAIEAIAARHAGMKVCGISCISNLACGMTDQPLSHAEVQEAADKAAPRFKELISHSIVEIEKVLF